VYFVSETAQLELKSVSPWFQASHPKLHKLDLESLYRVHASRLDPNLHGRPMQVGPMKQILKPTGIDRLKHKYDKLLHDLHRLRFRFQLAPLYHEDQTTEWEKEFAGLNVPAFIKLGRAVQVDPIRPELKVPEIKRPKS